MVVYRGALWCPPCGASGKPVLDHLKNNVDQDDVVVFGTNSGDAFSSAIGDAIGGGLMQKFSQNGIPHMFALGAEYSKNFYPSTGSVTAEINTINSSALRANMAVTAKLNANDEIEVTTHTKFFEDLNGNFTLAAYVLEDGLEGVQQVSGQGAVNMTHNNILRGSLTAGNFGDLIATNATAGEIIEHGFVGNYQPSWNLANLSIAVVLWNGNLNAVNAVVVPLEQ